MGKTDLKKNWFEW